MEQSEILKRLEIIGITNIDQLKEGDIDYWWNKKFLSKRFLDYDKDQKNNDLILINNARDELNKINIDKIRNSLALSKTTIDQSEEVTTIYPLETNTNSNNINDSLKLKDYDIRDLKEKIKKNKEVNEKISTKELNYNNEKNNINDSLKLKDYDIRDLKEKIKKNKEVNEKISTKELNYNNEKNNIYSKTNSYKRSFKNKNFSILKKNKLSILKIDKLIYSLLILLIFMISILFLNNFSFYNLLFRTKCITSPNNFLNTKKINLCIKNSWKKL